jgi:hypothetical protein
MGPPYVPLDSWVYPAIERLEAMGYVETAMLGMRPWTRLECARLVVEALGHQRSQEKDPPVANGLIASLKREFSGALNLLQVDVTGRLNWRASTGESPILRYLSGRRTYWSWNRGTCWWWKTQFPAWRVQNPQEWSAWELHLTIGVRNCEQPAPIVS